MGRRKRRRTPRPTRQPRGGTPATGGARSKPGGRNDGPSVAAPDAPEIDRWRPWLLGGLVALVVLRPLFPSESAAVSGDGLVVVMLWIVLAVFWLLAAVGKPWFPVRFGWTDAAVLLLVGWHTLAALVAANQGSPRPALNMLWEWIAYGLAFVLARQLITGRREMRAVLVVMIGLGVALAAYGMYQYHWELPATLRDFLEDPAATMQREGVWFEPGSREFELFRARLDTYRPMATFGLTNSLAGYLAPWLVVAAAIGATAGLSRGGWRRWLAVAVCGAPMAVCLVQTSSRTACAAAALGLLAVLGFTIARQMRRKGLAAGLVRPSGWKLAFAAAAVGAVLVGGLVAAVSLSPQVALGAKKSLGYRVEYWQATLRMIADHPITGCGPGNFQHVYTRYMLPEASEEIADPHNFLMEAWATAGTPALVALLAVLGCFAYALFRADDSLGDRPGTDAASSAALDGTPYVFGGAAWGFLLSVPIGQMSSAPPSAVELLPGVWFPTVVLFGLPLAAAAVILFWKFDDWVDNGPLDRWLPALGVGVLLVNLLAAGALGFPAVTGTLWLLLAIGLNLSGRSRPFAVPRSAHLAALAATMAAALTCSTTALNPVLQSQAAIRLAERGARDARRAGRLLEGAAEADPLSAEPRRLLAENAFRRWLVEGDPAAFAQFEKSMDAALRLAPRSASMWQMCANRYWEAYTRRGRETALPKAVEACRRAVELYPNSAQSRASLALALRASGDERGFREQADIALELNEQTPHGDKKLPDELLARLARSSSEDE